MAVALTMSVIAGAAIADVKGAAQTLLEEGANAVAARKFPEAHQKFQAAQKAAPEDQTIQDEATNWIHRALAAEGKVEDARKSLQAALAKRPSPVVAAELGRSYLQYQPVDTKASITFLLSVIDEKKGGYGAKHPEPWVALGRAYVLDSQYASAIRIYQLLLKNVKKDELRGYLGLADAYILAGKFKEAEELMNDAQRTFPDNPDVLFYVGRVKERDNRQKNPSVVAAHYYQSAARLANNSPRYAAAAMYAFLNAGDTTSALGLYTAQKARTPEDSYVLWFTGLNEEHVWHMPQAIALYERAIQTNPENVFAHFVLARLYLGVGNKSLRMSRGVEPPEGFRVAPFRNYQRGGQELATLKYIDPSFPGLQGLYDMYNRSMERQAVEQNMTPEQKSAMEQLINYTNKMNRFR